MSYPLQQMTDFLAAYAPLELAEEWDNVGLLLGDESSGVARAMTCLTLTPDVAEEAIQRGVNLIVSHHPILFRPVQRLTSETSEGRMILGLLQNRIAVYSPHTAFDSARLGVNQGLAEKLELSEIQPLRAAMQSDSPSPGAGRWGRLSQSMTFGEFLEQVRSRLRPVCEDQDVASRAQFHLQYTGDLQRLVSNVGIGCGSAAEFLKDASRVGCDVFLTGEARFHSCLQARAEEIGLVLIGHYASERPAIEELAKILQDKFPELEVWASRQERDPVSWSVER